MERIVEEAKFLRDGFNAIHQRGKILTPDDIDLAHYQQHVSSLFVAAPTFSRAKDAPVALQDAYHALVTELREQFAWMMKFGIDVVFCDDDPTPLDPITGRISHKLFVEEYLRTGQLRVFRSNPGHKSLEHIFLDRTGWWHNGRWENANSFFRAVHDFFGHLASGGHFGWRGETTAYYSHSTMFTEQARHALFSETTGQQAFYAIKKDFSPQKSVWFDACWHNPPLS